MLLYSIRELVTIQSLSAIRLVGFLCYNIDNKAVVIRSSDGRKTAKRNCHILVVKQQKSKCKIMANMIFWRILIDYCKCLTVYRIKE